MSSSSACLNLTNIHFELGDLTGGGKSCAQLPSTLKREIIHVPSYEEEEHEPETIDFSFNNNSLSSSNTASRPERGYLSDESSISIDRRRFFISHATCRSLDRLNKLPWNVRSSDLSTDSLSRRSFGKQCFETNTVGVCTMSPTGKASEDRYKVVDSLENVDILLGGVSYVGVFDGHGGTTAADYAISHLHLEIGRMLRKMSVKDAILTGFEKVEHSLLEQHKADKSGTCASVALIVHEDSTSDDQSPKRVKLSNQSDNNTKRIAYFATLGDSRIILSRNKQPVQIHEPHRLSNKDEKARVKAAWKEFNINSTLLYGHLGITRSLGDRQFKQSGTALSAVPEVSSYELTSDDNFVVIVSDGVTDVMSTQQIHDLVNTNITNGRVGNASSKLVTRALQLGARDDSTAIVLQL